MGRARHLRPHPTLPLKGEGFRARYRREPGDEPLSLQGEGLGWGRVQARSQKKKKPSVDRTEGLSEAEINRSGDDLGMTRLKRPGRERAKRT